VVVDLATIVRTDKDPQQFGVERHTASSFGASS
jgi:hypothetical protein